MFTSGRFSRGPSFAVAKGGALISPLRFFSRLNFQLFTLNDEPLTLCNFSTDFHNSFESRPPANPSLRQLEPHCVNPATTIRIANKLSLTSINSRATMVFDSSSPFSPPLRRPAGFYSSNPAFGSRAHFRDLQIEARPQLWSGDPDLGRSKVFPSYPLSFQTLARSFARGKNSTLLFSIVSALFAKNHPGWGVSTC
jgi:hypothetical protein